MLVILEFLIDSILFALAMTFITLSLWSEIKHWRLDKINIVNMLAFMCLGFGEILHVLWHVNNAVVAMIVFGIPFAVIAKRRFYNSD
jgi:hypothetical protein